MTGNLKQFTLITIKVVVTLLLFGWVISQVDLYTLQQIVSSANIGHLAIATVCHAAAFLLFSIRWWYLYRLQDRKFSYKHTFESYYLGLFCNNILPTGMGGDVVRILRLHRAGFDSHLLVSSTVLDRIIGLVTIILMGLMALLFIPNLNLSGTTINIIIVFTLVIPIGISFLFSGYSAKILSVISKRFEHNHIRNYLIKVLTSFHEYRRKRPQLLIALLLSFIAQYLVILSYIFIGASLNIDLPVLIYFSIIPIVFLATSLPVSVGGLGIRESILVYLFTLFGIDTQAAIALSLIYFSLIVFLTLPGGLVMLSKNKKHTPYSIETDSCIESETSFKHSNQ